MAHTKSLPGWQELADGWPWFQGEGSYPLPGYSEFNPPPRLVRKPYGIVHPHHFSPADPWGWPITEYEETLEINPGLHQTARELITALGALARGRPNRTLRGLLREGNPYWPRELLRLRGKLVHEHFVLFLPLALAITQDERCRPLWTIFGGSELGPGRAFWQSFTTAPDRAWTEERAIGFFRRLLHLTYDEPNEPGHDPFASGLRILPTGAANRFPRWDEGPLPSWAERFVWSPRESLHGVKYLLTFRPFAYLPAAVRRAYREGRLHLLPFPGSLIFWGSRPYHRLREQLPLAMQIPLLDLLRRHAGVNRLRVPQAGWLLEPGPRMLEIPGPVRNTAQRPHRKTRWFRDDDGQPADVLEEPLARILFSTRPEDLGLYNKPMARNVQLWTADFRLLLDGPSASPEELERAAQVVGVGGHFGYRFLFPAMRVGHHELYWHRPLVACRPARTGRPTVMDDAPLGLLTAYPVGQPVPAAPAAVLWPRLLRRGLHTANLELFRHALDRPRYSTLYNIRKLLDAHEMRGGEPLPRPLAQRLLALPAGGTLDLWLDGLAAKASDSSRGESLADELRRLLAPPTEPPASTRPPKSLTFARTARRSFEVAYWKAIAHLSAGPFVNKNNGDCCLDRATQARLRHPHRDLDAVADYLVARHTRAIERAGLAGQAFVGEHVFAWQTEWPYPWLGGWLNNHKGTLRERNLVVVIPGRDRSRAVLMADHYDTAYMRDIYDRNEGGNEARLAAPGADDNGSATATLLLAAPILLTLSKKGKLACDVWLVHLTGEEFPADGAGARRLCQDLVQGTFRLRGPGKKEVDLSSVRIQATVVLDMIAHRTKGQRGVFQITPGVGREALQLAELAHAATETWNAATPFWNEKSKRRGRFRKSTDPKQVPVPAPHPLVVGEVRPPHDPRSTLYNADSQTFSDAGIPVVLLMEDYDIGRLGYHDTGDTVAGIDLDYGAALAAIAIETVARAASG